MMMVIQEMMEMETPKKSRIQNHYQRNQRHPNLKRKMKMEMMLLLKTLTKKRLTRLMKKRRKKKKKKRPKKQMRKNRPNCKHHSMTWTLKLKRLLKATSITQRISNSITWKITKVENSRTLWLMNKKKQPLQHYPKQEL